MTIYGSVNKTLIFWMGGAQHVLGGRRILKMVIRIHILKNYVTCII